MMMKRIAMAAAVMLLGGVLSAERIKAPNAQEGLKAAQNLFLIIKAEEQYNQGVKAAIDAQIQKKPQFKQFRPQMEEAVNKGMPWSSMKNDLAKIYAKEMVADDINKTAEFYQTPAGGKLFQKLVDKTISWEKIQADPSILSKTFSPEELTQIMAFVQTPAGMKLVMKGPVIAKNSETYIKQRADKVIKSAAQKVMGDILRKNAGNIKF